MPRKDQRNCILQEALKLKVLALKLPLAVSSAAAVLIRGLANLIYPGYGADLLKLLSPMYPGYKVSGAVADLISGILYALKEKITLKFPD